jgi:hypothetical protein
MSKAQGLTFQVVYGLPRTFFLGMSTYLVYGSFFLMLPSTFRHPPAMTMAVEAAF